MAEVKAAPPLFICIIGGGLAGLACALSLQAVGIRCHVFERDESISQRKQGFGLTLTNSRTGALAQLGVLDACLAQDCASYSHYVFDEQGQILGYFGRGHSDEESKDREMTRLYGPRKWRSANLRIPRQNLRKMLFDRLQPDTVTWGARVSDFTETKDAVTVKFQDGTTVQADVLVGADGINSVIRKMQDRKIADTSSALEYLGIVAIIGLSPATHPLLHERGFYTLGHQCRLFTMPFSESTLDEQSGSVVPALTMWQFSFAETSEAAARALSSSEPEQLLAVALERTEGWMHPVKELLAATPVADVWATPLYDRPPRKLKDTPSSRVTVVGDACHPMSMFKGQGANQALQDGPLLARMLTSVDRTFPASPLDGSGRPLLDRAALLNRIRRFDSEMISRTSVRVRASRVAAQVLHAPGASKLSDTFGIGGVSLTSEQLLEVLVACREKNVGAHLAARLDEDFRVVLDRTVPPANRTQTKPKHRKEDDD